MEQTPVTTELTEAETLSRGLEETRKITEFRHKQLSTLTVINIQNFCAMMISTNGVSYAEKVQAAEALTEAIKFSLDFGLGITKADIRESGKLAKDVNRLAGILVQSMDNRFLLLAQNMKDQQDSNETVTTTNEETKETQNV